MFGFLKSLFLDKKAQHALAKRASAGKPVSARDEAIRQAQANMRKMVTPDRAELIRKAMEVHRAKQAVFADLSDSERSRLVALALKRLLNEGKDG
ncbi:MAG: hypothetical protein M0006_00215 [Magnetospirillum sp.]|nr:hypothetical protein [Magnetospirillum sp.]